MANAYFGTGAKFAHPCYQLGKGFVCPTCGETFPTEAPMENHYLSHNPPKNEAENIVRWQRFQKHFKTPEYFERLQKQKHNRKIRKQMKEKGYRAIPKSSIAGRLGFSFAIGQKWLTFKEAEAILSS